MNYRTRKTLQHLLPLLLWAVAIAVVVLLTMLRVSSLYQAIAGVILALLSFAAYRVVYKVDRHEGSASEEAFLSSFLLSLGSYVLPAMLFLIPVLWGILIARAAWDLRTFCASIIGVGAVGLPAIVMIVMGWIQNAWQPFFAATHLWIALPVLLFWLTYVLVTIVSRSLRER